jgi:hypothetical protein
MSQVGTEVTDLRVEVARQDERLQIVEEGVSNFRAFQAEVRDFIVRSDDREEARESARVAAQQRDDKRKERLHTAVLAFLATIAAGGTSWIGVALVGWVKTHLAH